MQTYRLWLQAIVLWTLGVTAALSAPPETPRVALPLMKDAPTMDGAIDEEEWAGATRVVGFVSQHTAALTPREGMFWVGCDGQKLYLAVKTEAPPTGELLTRAVPDGNRDILPALYDDSLEFWIDPHRGRTTGDRRYFQIITNERGALFDRSYDPANPQNPVDVTWRVEWEFASQVREGWWHAEVAIPLSSLGAENDLDHPWGVRVVRDWQRGWDQSRWESVLTAFEDQPSMPVVTWDPQAPVVQMLSLHEEHRRPALSVKVWNPHAAELPVHVFLQDAWSMNPPQELDRALTLAPGAAEVVTLQAPDMGPEGDHRTLLRVTSPDGQREYFVREFNWNLHRPAEVWTIAEEEKQAVEVAFKYYPYHHKIRVKVNLESLAARDQVTGATVQVRPAGEETALAEQPFPPLAKGGPEGVENFQAETIFDVPDLPDGTYQLAVLLQGGEGVPKEPVIREFERRHFEWEHNRLGLSETVIPPFTPLEIKEREKAGEPNASNLQSPLSIFAVGREYQANDAGLWDQILSLGEPLLAGPMRWEVVSHGQVVPVEAGDLRVVRARPHEVVTEARWTAGPVQATVQGEYDYDGMMKVTLHLGKSAIRTPPFAKGGPGGMQSAIEKLSLVIPLHDRLMPYLHACGDGLRHNYAGKTPAGEGRIWDSSRGNKVNIVGTFYPYLWLGGAERGLCWFADTDRDWVLDETTPTLELVRAEGTLEMRVHFITKPTTLERTHTLVFGLQATPVKPMPTNWRKWQCAKWFAGGLPFRILGASYYYGCLSFDFYPRDRDFSIWEKISEARDTGEVDEEFVNRWIEGYAKLCEPGSDQYKMFDAHIRYTFREAPHTKRADGWFYVPYTNPRGIGFQMEEWPTFQDEWVNYAYFNRSQSGGLAYEITPTLSFQDCALWYYRKMMACFDGIYWDNIFLAANWDPVVGGAWEDEQGRVHPGLGLFAMRELIKRTAVMFHEEGRPGLFIPHMTNTNLVPILAFANVNLDWEWRYGQADFQDRFAPDLTVAETIGRQTGNVPLILSGGWYDDQAPDWARVMRTRLGVTLVHELRVWDYRPDLEVELLRKLYEFGYGEPDCQVFNYWDEDSPVQVAGVDGKTLVLSRGQRAIVVVTDYGEGGNCRLTLDLARLNLPPESTARDLETDEPVHRAAPGVLAFPLQKHDFKVVLVE